MPRKDRPAPLSDVIYRGTLDKRKAPGGPIGGPAPLVPEEIPVHNTFIQFASPDGLEFEKQHLSTAPAWIGPSVQSMIQSAMQPAPQAMQSEYELPLLADGGAAGDAKEWSSLNSPKKLASPKKVPVMRYSLSASSARAAGVPAAGAVVASYEQGWADAAVMEAKPSWPDVSTTQAGDDDVAVEDVDGESGEEKPQGPPVPLEDLPSIGSAKHHEGLCKRCCFFPKGRCQNDKDCEFCHFDHEKRKRKKKKKKKGDQKDGSESEGSDSEDDESKNSKEGNGKAAKEAAPQEVDGGSIAYETAISALSDVADVPEAELWCATPPSRGAGTCTVPGDPRCHGLQLSDASMVPPQGLPSPGSMSSPMAPLDVSEIGGQTQAQASAWQACGVNDYEYEIDPYYGYGSNMPSAMDAYGQQAYGRMPPLGAPVNLQGGATDPRLSGYLQYSSLHVPGGGYHAADMRRQAPPQAPPSYAAPVPGGRPAPR